MLYKYCWHDCGCRTTSDDTLSLSSKKIGELRVFYEKTDVFVIDEVNAMSANMLAEMHETMTAIFNPNRKIGEDRNELPFGGKKMVFLGQCFVLF